MLKSDSSNSNSLKLQVAAPSQHEIPRAEASAQSTEENASTADENQAFDDTKSTRVAEEIPAPEETARATTNVAPKEHTRPAEAFSAPEEAVNARATAPVMPKDTELT